MSFLELFSEILPIVSVLVVGLLSLVGALYSISREKKETRKNTSEKFKELSDLLMTASSRIKEMENELEVRRRRVKKLEKLRKELDSLVSLREEQVTAIRTELNSIMEKFARRNKIWTIIMGAIWFIIGLVVRGLLGF